MFRCKFQVMKIRNLCYAVIRLLLLIYSTLLIPQNLSSFKAD